MKTDDKRRPDVPSPPANTKMVVPEHADGPVYRLRVMHVLSNGMQVPAGTIVGAGTPFPWTEEPSNAMEGANPAGVEEVNKLHQKLYGKDAPWYGQDVEEDLKLQKTQRQEEAEAVPVSHAQAVEQGKKWEGLPDPVMQARLTGNPAPAPQSFTGEPAVPGVATPRVEADPREPIKPLEDQLPKGG